MKFVYSLSNPKNYQLGIWPEKGEKGPNFPKQKFMKCKRMLIMTMDKNGIAFCHLCEEKETVTSEVYITFLETYIPKWMTDKEIQGSGVYSQSCQFSLIKSCYRLFNQK